MKLHTKMILTSTFISFISATAMAQDTPPPPMPPPPPGLPIDGPILIIVGIALIYGIKKALEIRQNEA